MITGYGVGGGMLFQIMVREVLYEEMPCEQSPALSEVGLDFQCKNWDSPRQTGQLTTLAQNATGSLAACLQPLTQENGTPTSSKSRFQKHLLSEKLIQLK